MSYNNTLLGNYNNYCLSKAKCFSMDLTEYKTDPLFIKSPFDRIPKTNIPSIKKEIYIKKNHIKSLVLDTLGPNYYYPMNCKKIKSKTSNNSIILNTYNYDSSNYFRKNNYTRNRKIKDFDNVSHDKISLGKLNFFSLQDYKPSEKEKQVKYQKMERAIRRSQYFSSEKGGIITDSYIKKQYNKIHLHTDSEKSLDKIIKKSYKLKNNNENNRLSINNLQNSFQINENNTFNDTKLNNNNSNINFYNTFTFFKKDIKNFSQSPKYKSKKINLNMRNLRKFEIKYFKQADKINKKFGKMNKKLFRISDKADLKKNQGPVVDKIIEEVFDKKLKKKKKFFGTKELFLKTSNEKDIYTNMGKDKKDLLKMSEIVQNMSDEEALRFSENILEQYSFKENLLHLDEENNIIQRNKFKNNDKIKKKLEKNNRKLKKLFYNIDEKRNKLYIVYNRILSKNKKNN